MGVTEDDVPGGCEAHYAATSRSHHQPRPDASLESRYLVTDGGLRVSQPRRRVAERERFRHRFERREVAQVYSEKRFHTDHVLRSLSRRMQIHGVLPVA
jgi:hypothetical protein